jgi:hypothetical protein
MSFYLVGEVLLLSSLIDLYLAAIVPDTDEVGQSMCRLKELSSCKFGKTYPVITKPSSQKRRTG